MKTKISSFIPLLAATQPGSHETISTSGYIVGAIVAVFILGYLVYTLFHPEKF